MLDKSAWTLLETRTRAPHSTPAVPDHDWDLWIGCARWRPYHPAYHPFTWRAYWDFGTGAIGDMGCHLLNLATLTMDLGNPETVVAGESAKRRKPDRPNHISSGISRTGLVNPPSNCIDAIAAGNLLKPYFPVLNTVQWDSDGWDRGHDANALQWRRPTQERTQV